LESATLTRAIYNPKGVDVKAAEQHVLKKGSLKAFDQDHVDPKELLSPLPTCCAGSGGSGNQRNERGQIKCRILAEAANGPTTPAADVNLGKRWDEVF
jgi:glutamate dehydrogenase (NAD(P)+)